MKTRRALIGPGDLRRRASGGAASLVAALIAIDAASAAPLALAFAEREGASIVTVEAGGGGFQVERAGARAVDIITDDPIAPPPASVSGRANGPATRIAAVRAVPQDGAYRLRLLLNCDCEYATRISATELALEFSDRSEKAETAEDVAPRRLADLNAGATAPAFAPAPTPRHVETETAAAASPDDQQDAPDGKTAAQTREEILIARRRLLEQLAKAADQGLLKFTSPEAAAAAPGVLAPPPAEPVEPVDAAPADAEVAEADAAPTPPSSPPAPTPTPAPQRPPEVELPVRVRTAVERTFAADRSDTIARVAPCVEPRLAALEWPAEASFDEAARTLTGELLDKAGSVRAASASALARLYISHGMGVEAGALLAGGEEDQALLRDLARIIEGGAPDPTGPLAVSGPCGGWSSLWLHAAGFREAAAPEAAKADAADILDAMIDSLAAAPRPLRAVLGPMAMTELIARGDVDAARRVDLVLRRMDGDFGPAFDLARARLLTATGEAEGAEALFSRLARRDLPESREALLELFASRAARGAPVGSDLADALGEAAFIARNDAIERPLRIAEARARFLAEGLPQALATLADALARAPEDEPILRDAVHEVLERADAARDGPLAYARAALSAETLISTDRAGDAARRRVADELTGVGLGNAALRVLEPSLGRGAPDVRRAAARAKIALEDADGALTLLEGLPSLDAQRLRAAAFEMRGAEGDGEMAASLETGEAPQVRARRAFRAGEWRKASDVAETPERLLAAFMADAEGEAATVDPEAEEDERAAAFLSSPESDAEITLGGARAVMDASKSVRSLIEEALEDG